MFESAVAGSGSRISRARSSPRGRPGDGEDPELGGDVRELHRPELGQLVLDRLRQEILVVRGPGPRRDEVEGVLAHPRDGILGPHRPRLGQRVGQADPARLRQPVAGEPLQERGGAGTLQQVLREGGGVDHPDLLADRLRLLDRVGPPAAAAEAAGGMVVEPLRRIVDRPLPAVHLPELRAPRLHPVVAGRGAQRPAGLALLVGVVQHEDVGVALLVLPRRILGGDPRAVALRVERRHVDLGLALDHHLREIVPGPARRGDPERETLRQPQVAQARRRPDQRVAVRRVADRPVEVVLQPHRLRRRKPVDHRHVLLLDPLQVQREEIGPEALRHRVREPRRGALLVRPEDPAATLLADVPLRVGVAQHRVLGVALAPLDERRVRLGDDILVLHRDRRNLDAEEPRGALGVVAGGGDDMLGADLEALLAGHQVAAAVRHDPPGDDPLRTRPAIAVDLRLAHDLDAPLPRPLGQRLGDVRRVDIAIGGMEERALQILGADQRPAVADLRRGEKLVRDADGLGGGRIELVLVHPIGGLRHPQVADHGEAGVQPGLGLQRLVELHR